MGRISNLLILRRKAMADKWWNCFQSSESIILNEKSHYYLENRKDRIFKKDEKTKWQYPLVIRNYEFHLCEVILETLEEPRISKEVVRKLLLK